LLVPLFALALCHATKAQGIGTVALSDQDLRDVIAAYRQPDLPSRVAQFRQGMPSPAIGERFRASIHRNLPTDYGKVIIEEPRLTEAVRKVLRPVLVLYGRENIYDIIVIRHPTPIMMSDSGVVLLLSTGMIMTAESDDELLGYAAHEIGHEYFVYYSVESRHLLRTVSARGNEPALTRKLAEVLALLELQCDAFAALTLSFLNYNPLAFVRGLERVEARYPDQAWGGHPNSSDRRRVVEGLTPTGARQAATRVSDPLSGLKALTAAYAHAP
jgi:hypothetical protein